MVWQTARRPWKRPARGALASPAWKRAWLCEAVCPDARHSDPVGLCAEEAETAIDHRLTPVVWELPHLIWLEAAAKKRGLRAGHLPVHLEIDTGMSRQGAAPEPDRAAAGSISGRASPLRMEALMTHFPSPETARPRTCSSSVCLQLPTAITAQRNPAPGVPECRQFGRRLAARPSGLPRTRGPRRTAPPHGATGIALYGYRPCLPLRTRRRDCRPVLAWKTRVVSLRTIEPGTAVGYDATFTAHRTTRLALLPVGYADGLNRLLSNRGSVLVRGQRAPIAGRISMDHTVVDVTEIPGVETWRRGRLNRRTGWGAHHRRRSGIRDRHDRLRGPLRDLRARARG